MSRNIVYIYLSVAILLLVGFLISLNFDKQQLFPIASGSNTIYNVAHEEMEEGWSQSSVSFEKDSSLRFRYQLSDKLQEPFTGVYLYKDSANSFFDFSSFDVLTIQLKANKARRIPVYLTIDYNGNPEPKNKFPSLPLVYVIDYKGEKAYSINKSDFEVPSWWLRYQGLKREELGELDFSKVNYILINSCQVLQPGIPDEMIIKRVSLSNSNENKYWVFGGLLLILLITFSAHRFWMRKKILIPYKVNEVDLSKNQSKSLSIINYIGQNFSNPELSMNDLEMDLGISGREIGNILKKEFNASFKEYLNTIRLAEVKRLLKESDLSVSEIAYRSGYNNISHFNRVFKKEMDLSPKEYREVNSIS